jgi:hypothetical protein
VKHALQKSIDSLALKRSRGSGEQLRDDLETPRLEEEVLMSHFSLVNEASNVSPRSSQPRAWDGSLVQSAERPTLLLHLLAVPCDQCRGPVILGWIGTRKDDISRETGIKGLGAVCLSCGCRPKTLIDPLHACHFRPVQWEWTIEKKLEATDREPPSSLFSDPNHEGNEQRAPEENTRAPKEVVLNPSTASSKTASSRLKPFLV